MNIDLDHNETLPYVEVSVCDLQRHNFVISSCLQEKLSVCECGQCPKQLEVMQAPKVLFVLLEDHRLLFEDISIEKDFVISSKTQQFHYRL